MRIIFGFMAFSILLTACSRTVTEKDESDSYSLVAARWTNAPWLPEVKAAFTAYDARNVEDAFQGLDSAWKNGCRDALVGYRYAFVLDRKGESERAKMLYLQVSRSLTNEYPDHPYAREVWHNLGHIEYRAGRFEESLSLYRTADRYAQGTNKEIAFSVGMALRRLKRFSEAIAWFEKADQKDFRTNFYLADVYYEMKKLDLAMQAMQRAVDADPGSSKALGSLGHYWYALSEQREEESDFSGAQDAIRSSLKLYERAISAGGTNYLEYRKAAKARISDLERLKAVAKTNGLTRVPLGQE